MRIANVAGRLALVTDTHALDVNTASGGTFPSDPQAIYDVWDAFRQWAATADFSTAIEYSENQLQVVVPRPRQVFAIGLNYREHALESGLAIPTDPVVFTKFQSSLAGPRADVELPSEAVDYEVELVVVLGREAHSVSPGDAWDHVAGLTAGQDISERNVQTRGPAPQFSVAKSYPGFSPIGPVVVTPDEFPDRNAIRVRTLLWDGAELVTKQDGNTNDLIFSVPELISRLSQTLTLYPGDIIFTGTPSGVGNGKRPPEFLKKGQTLVTDIAGIGELRNRLV
jgi:2-keto-4-pentenoate hydratase/2-oxohepta-3-ene-1,7-dioic acid hydratase in catechol pathway